jgi:hypothetical protein
MPWARAGVIAGRARGAGSGRAALGSQWDSGGSQPVVGGALADPVALADLGGDQPLLLVESAQLGRRNPSGQANRPPRRSGSSTRGAGRPRRRPPRSPLILACGQGTQRRRRRGHVAAWRRGGFVALLWPGRCGPAPEDGLGSCTQISQIAGARQFPNKSRYFFVALSRNSITGCSFAHGRKPTSEPLGGWLSPADPGNVLVDRQRNHAVDPIDPPVRGAGLVGWLAGRSGFGRLSRTFRC